MNTTAIGVFGLSGVGKTTLIQKFIKENSNYVHIQAGYLIKKGMEHEADQDSLRLKDFDGINDNQRILIQQFELAKIENKSKHIIFDGHMVIDTNTNLVEIPFEVIKLLRLDKIIAISVDGSRILSQRARDKTRNRPERSLEEISKQQTISTQLCEKYADKLGVPFFEVCADEYEIFSNECMSIVD